MMAKWLRAGFGLLRRVFVSRSQSQGTLVIQPLPGIGDMIWHLPHLHALAAVEGGLSLLARSRSHAAELLRYDTAVIRVLDLERRPGRHDGIFGTLRLILELRRKRFARAWLLHQSEYYAWVLLFAGIPRTIGYGFRIQRYLLTETVYLSTEEQKKHPYDKAGILLTKAGIRLIEAEPKMCMDDNAVLTERKVFAGLAQPWIALGIGSSEPDKQWGSVCFADLALCLQRDFHAGVVLIGGPTERQLSEEIVARVVAQGGQPPLAPVLPLSRTAAVLANCRLYIGNDTGALNLAAALCVPALGLFGASPPLDHSAFIHVVQPLAGDGMAQITVAQVANAAARLLAVDSALQ